MFQQQLSTFVLCNILILCSSGIAVASSAFCTTQWQTANQARSQLNFQALINIREQVRNPCPKEVFTHVENLMTQVAGAKAQTAFASNRFVDTNYWLNQAPTTAWYILALRGDMAAAQRNWTEAALHYNTALDLSPPQNVRKELITMAGQATVLSGTLTASIQRSGDGAGLYNSRGSYSSIPAPILFDYDQATLTANGRASTKRLAAYVSKRLQQQPQLQVTIIGHTDNRGSDAYNCALSLRRARTVQQVMVTMLREYAIAATRITIQGQGERVPFPVSSLSPPLTAEERFALDRRVEVTFSKLNNHQEASSCTSN